MSSFRVGTGYDIHRTIKNQPLILGGVKIESDFGLDGHSDADVLVHAIMDSLLGAAALFDIGHYFPPNNMDFKDISSLILLKKVFELLKEKEYEIVNIDSVIIAEKPKINKYVIEMKKNIGKVLNLPENCIGIKATTNERIGCIGRGEGIAATATCMLEKRKNEN
jgi:2-C-methyl-D-erythritol 2,4-cyclodiphosphate synthase